ncbi:MAG: 2-isopropylmalate synthase [Acidobacteriaceae bacterium]|nr:2-isopropylmalate synthase [Acidobacteriaceae bacterium]MBV9305878.1 2-isopropylmalate synthase [Acidobacteriaceae bacterium]MBV9939788.1 2-isopropylmalate synthase [Acidobacteriaceae bacterium]
MNRVYIFDTTLRDGEQSPGCSMTMPEKLEVAAKLVDLGVDVLEAGFPIASEGDFEAVRAVSRQFPWVQVAALARACTGDVQRAAEALERAKRPRIHTFIATSDIHLKHKLRRSREQMLDDAIAAVTLARNYTDDVEFSAEDATRTDIDFLQKVCQAVVEAGARTVNLPDTVGYSVPEEYGALIGRMVKALGDRATVSVHCHDDLGLAVANSLAAIKAGARQIECTINGIGERAGNAALEEVVMAMKVRHDQLPFETKIQTEKLFSASQTLTKFICFGPQPNKAIVGDNAFAHEAGIHQDGYLKEKSTYEIMSPASVGVPESRLVLGKHSGRHALSKRAEDLGFKLSREELDQVYRQFTALADNKKGLRNDEISALIQTVVQGKAVHETVAH